MPDIDRYDWTAEDRRRVYRLAALIPLREGSDLCGRLALVLPTRPDLEAIDPHWVILSLSACQRLSPDRLRIFAADLVRHCTDGTPQDTAPIIAGYYDIQDLPKPILAGHKADRPSTLLTVLAIPEKWLCAEELYWRIDRTLDAPGLRVNERRGTFRIAPTGRHDLISLFLIHVREGKHKIAGLSELERPHRGPDPYAGITFADRKADPQWLARQEARR
jgi:hypothetical protein